MRRLRFALATLALASLALAAAPAPVRPVSPSDLVGDWVAEPFLAGLKATRSPIGSPDPLAFSVTKHGKGYRLKATNFHEAYWRALGGVEAEAGGSYLLVLGPNESEPRSAKDLTRLRVRIAAGADGPETLTGDLWEGEEKEIRFRRLPGPLGPHLIRLVLAGAYRDEDGRRYAFGEDGEAVWPGEAFRFELNLDASEAGCDFITRPDPREPGGQKRVGFGWKDGALRLFHVLYDRDVPISPASRPFAVLSPEAGWKPAARRERRVALQPLPIVPLHEGDFGSLVGGGARVEVHFGEPGAKKMPEVLTEPPAKVRHFDGRAPCEIGGGNWVPNRIWLSRDERVLALVAFSGSSAQLELYETAGCKLLGSIEAAGSRLDVEGNRITFFGGCDWSDDTHARCVPATVHRLDDDGVPRKRTDESRLLTKETFGIAFDEPSDLEFPGGGLSRERAGRTPYADAPRLVRRQAPGR